MPLSLPHVRIALFLTPLECVDTGHLKQMSVLQYLTLFAFPSGSTVFLTPLVCVFANFHFSKSFRMNVCVTTPGGVPPLAAFH